MNKPSIQVLLADDDIDDCELFKDVLDEMQLPVDLATVHNGETLMQLLRQQGNALPDILFLDLNMPRKNGFECLSEIRQDKRLKDLPVIVFSTSFDMQIIDLLYKNGAWHYIRKPNEFDKLKKVIREALSSGVRNATVRVAREEFVLLP